MPLTASRGGGRRIRKAWPWLLLLLALFWPARSPAQESNWKAKVKVSGYLKSFFLVSAPKEIEGDSASQGLPAEGLNQNKVRLILSLHPKDSVGLEMAYEMLPTVQAGPASSSLNFISAPVAPAYRVDDTSRNIYPKPGDRQGNFSLSQNLDRAMLTLASSRGSVSLGRQPISFGVAHVISPTDIIAPYAFNQLDTEYRIGVDAVRAKFPLGAKGGFDLGAIFGEDFRIKQSAAFVRTTFPWAKNQFGLLALEFKDNLLAGLDFTRTLGGAGVWLEGAYTWAKLFDQPAPEQDYFRASTGLDYNLNYWSGIYLFLEYHYNGASKGDPGQYLAQTAGTAYQDGGVYLLGRHYLAPGISFQVTPLVTLSGAGLANLEDGSFYLSPQIEYNCREDVYLALGANLAAGKAGRLSSLGLQPQSEFGLYPDFYFSSIRLYF